MILQWPLKNIEAIPPIAPNPQTDIYISQGFGSNPQIYAQFGMKGHNGVDIAAPLDTHILAPHDGTMTFLTDSAGYGNNIRILFNADGFMYEVVLGHLHKYEGQPRDVKQGELIGYVDSTGFSTGNHCHLGVRKYLNGTVLNYDNGFLGYLDPMQFLKGSEMILFKSKTDQTVYAQNGDTLTGFDTMDSYNKFTDGRNPVIVLLDPEELAKFIISPVVMKL
jgi:murein DD-endopeptidase MepM/ murein hydrolase activator NlpD